MIISISDFEDPFFPGQPNVPILNSGPTGDNRCPVETSTIFGIDSYEAILYGMDFLAPECDDWFGKDRPATRVAKSIADRLALAPRKLPPHELWMQRVLGMPDYPAASGSKD